MEQENIQVAFYDGVAAAPNISPSSSLPKEGVSEPYMAINSFQPAPVHPAEPALAHQIGLTEPARSRGQLRQREPAGGGAGATDAAAAHVDGALGLGGVAGVEGVPARGEIGEGLARMAVSTAAQE